MRLPTLILGLAALALVAAGALAESASPAPSGGAESAAPPVKSPPAEKSAPGGEGEKRPHRTGLGEHNPGMFRDVTDEDVNDILAFTREYMPQTNAELLKAKDADPTYFRQMCRRLRFEIRQFRALKADDPEAFRKALEERQLQAHARELGQSFRKSSDPAERERLKTELKGTLQKMFDAEMITKRAQIRRLEESLKKVRDDLQDRETRREEVIVKQLDDMTSPRADAEPLDQPGTPKGEGKRGPKAEGKR